MRRNKSKYFILENIKKYIYNNLNFYIIMSFFFLIGIIAGVLFSNNINNDVQKPIYEYLNNFTILLKQGYGIDFSQLLKQVIVNRFILVLLIWFMGCTVIGMPIVYSIICWKGFSLSYCISTIILNFGAKDGIILCLLSLLLQNIIIIPTILSLGVSGNKLYKSIMQDKRKENIKFEIIRHTFFSSCMFLLLVISAFIEVYISSNLTRIFIIKILSI